MKVTPPPIAMLVVVCGQNLPNIVRGGRGRFTSYSHEVVETFFLVDLSQHFWPGLYENYEKKKLKIGLGQITLRKKVLEKTGYLGTK